MSSLKKISQTGQIGHIGEFGLIEKISKIAHVQKSVLKGIGDDTAVLEYKDDKFLLFTTDMIAEDVHFTKKMNPLAIGHKALACNISDVAAMGGLPLYAVISLAAPKNLEICFVENIYKGINALAKKFNISIVGGDTITGKKMIINVALLGEVKKERLVLRSTAKKGDRVFVTGKLGRSLATGKHLSFTPRLKESQYLVECFKPTAMIDISDGLAGDFGHILKESRVGGVLYESLIPRMKNATLRNALEDGEDFELLFTLPPLKANELLRLRNCPFHFYYIGDIVDEKEGFVLINKQGERCPASPRAFEHFC